MDAASHTRFAAYDTAGRLVALVADGAPEWPADGNLSPIGDADLHTMEQAYLADHQRFSSLPDDQITADVITQWRSAREHVQALRDEAARRLAAASAAPAAEPAPAVTEPPAAPAAPALSAEDRAAALADLRGDLAPAPAPEAQPGDQVPAGTTLSREDLVAAMSAAAEVAARATTAALNDAVTKAVTAAAEQKPPTVQVVSEPVTARGVSAFRPSLPALDEGAERPAYGRLNPRMLATSNEFLNGRVAMEAGKPIKDMDTLAEAMAERYNRGLGVSSSGRDEPVQMAHIPLDTEKVPAERDLRGLALGSKEARAKIKAVVGRGAVGVNPFTGKEALVASGGLPYPLEPLYTQVVLSDSDRPTKAALTQFIAGRGGITTVLPPSFSSLTVVTRPGSYTDVVTTSASATITSATAAFSQADVGKSIVETDAQGVIPAGTIINSVTNATTAVLSANATGSATGVAVYLASRNPNNLGGPVGLVTSAQDAAGQTIKYTYDVQAGAQVSFPVYSVYTSLQFANLTAQVNPESVEANIKLADAVAARVAETQMLDLITNYSTLLTAPKTFGTARQLLGQVGHNAAFYRNLHRMDPKAVLMWGIPAWVVNNLRQDFFSTFLGVTAPDWALSDDEIDNWFASQNLVPWYYWDGPSDITQLFTSTTVQASIAAGTNTGTNTATPFTLPDWPNNGQAGTSFRNRIVGYLWDPAVWLGLTTGELNLGLVRDSTLNSQNRFRNFVEEWETPAFIGPTGSSMRMVLSVAADGTYGAAATIAVAPGNGL